MPLAQPTDINPVEVFTTMKISSLATSLHLPVQFLVVTFINPWLRALHLFQLLYLCDLQELLTFP
jgi:hypothetical protein